MIFCCLSGVTFINHLNAWAFVTFCFTVYFLIELPTPDCTKFFWRWKKICENAAYVLLSLGGFSLNWSSPLIRVSLSFLRVCVCFPHRLVSLLRSAQADFCYEMHNIQGQNNNIGAVRVQMAPAIRTFQPENWPKFTKFDLEFLRSVCSCRNSVLILQNFISFLLASEWTKLNIMKKTLNKSSFKLKFWQLWFFSKIPTQSRV